MQYSWVDGVWPGDLLILSLSIFFSIYLRIYQCYLFPSQRLFFLNSGMFSLGCSTVKTLLKYCNGTSAFPVSDEVNLGEVSVPGICKSRTFALVLSLDCVYFQNRLGFDLDIFRFLIMVYVLWISGLNKCITMQN